MGPHLRWRKCHVGILACEGALQQPVEATPAAADASAADASAAACDAAAHAVAVAFAEASDAMVCDAEA